MAVNTEIRRSELYTKVNMTFGLKEYRQVKKTMTEFEARLQQEQAKLGGVDHRIK